MLGICDYSTLGHEAGAALAIDWRSMLGFHELECFCCGFAPSSISILADGVAPLQALRTFTEHWGMFHIIGVIQGP